MGNPRNTKLMRLALLAIILIVAWFVIFNRR